MHLLLTKKFARSAGNGFEAFSQFLWATASEGEGELEDSVLNLLAAWWETERMTVLESLWDRVRSLKLSA